MDVMIFLDDERDLHDVTWVDYRKYWGYYILTFRTTKDAIEFIQSHELDWHQTVFSLDHDLQEFDGDTESTGYTFVKWLVDYLIENEIDLQQLDVIAHTKNPIGKDNIEKYVKNAKEFYLRTPQ